MNSNTLNIPSPTLSTNTINYLSNNEDEILFHNTSFSTIPIPDYNSISLMRFGPFLFDHSNKSIIDRMDEELQEATDTLDETSTYEDSITKANSPVDSQIIFKDILNRVTHPPFNLQEGNSTRISDSNNYSNYPTLTETFLTATKVSQSEPFYKSVFEESIKIHPPPKNTSNQFENNIDVDESNSATFNTELISSASLTTREAELLTNSSLNPTFYTFNDSSELSLSTFSPIMRNTTNLPLLSSLHNSSTDENTITTDTLNNKKTSTINPPSLQEKVITPPNLSKTGYHKISSTSCSSQFDQLAVNEPIPFNLSSNHSHSAFLSSPSTEKFTMEISSSSFASSLLDPRITSNDTTITNTDSTVTNTNSTTPNAKSLIINTDPIVTNTNSTITNNENHESFINPTVTQLTKLHGFIQMNDFDCTLNTMITNDLPFKHDNYLPSLCATSTPVTSKLHLPFQDQSSSIPSFSTHSHNFSSPTSLPYPLGTQILTSLTCGGLQYLMCGIRSNCGLKHGRYAFEVRIVDFNPNIPFTRDYYREDSIAPHSTSGRSGNLSNFINPLGSTGLVGINSALPALNSGLNAHNNISIKQGTTPNSNNPSNSSMPNSMTSVTGNAESSSNGSIRGTIRIGVCTLDDSLFLSDSPTSWCIDNDGMIYHDRLNIRNNDAKPIEKYDTITVVIDLPTHPTHSPNSSTLSETASSKIASESTKENKISKSYSAIPENKSQKEINSEVNLKQKNPQHSSTTSKNSSKKENHKAKDTSNTSKTGSKSKRKKKTDKEKEPSSINKNDSVKDTEKIPILDQTDLQKYPTKTSDLKNSVNIIQDDKQFTRDLFVIKQETSSTLDEANCMHANESNEKNQTGQNSFIENTPVDRKGYITFYTNGIQISEAQSFPISILKDKGLYPCITFRGATLIVNFGSLHNQSHLLPADSKYMQEAHEEDVEWSNIVRPASGKYEVIFPIGIPNEGVFDMCDLILSSYPNQFIELSDRMIIQWAESSGLHRTPLYRRRPREFEDCLDNPSFNFGNKFLDEPFYLLRTIKLIASSRPRNYIVMELKKNLTPIDRKESLRLFSAIWFQKRAMIVIGRPPHAFQIWQQYLSSHLYDEMKLEYNIGKSGLHIPKRIIDKQAMQELRDLYYSIIFQSKSLAPHNSTTFSNILHTNNTSPTSRFDYLSTNSQINLSSLNSSNSKFSISKAGTNTTYPPPSLNWFRKKDQEDLRSKTLASSFTSFSLPFEGEGFDYIDYLWFDKFSAQTHLNQWITRLKFTTVMYDHTPSPWLKSKITEWDNICKYWKMLETTTMEKYNFSNPQDLTSIEDNLLYGNQDKDKIINLAQKIASFRNKQLLTPSYKFSQAGTVYRLTENDVKVPLNDDPIETKNFTPTTNEENHIKTSPKTFEFQENIEQDNQQEDYKEVSKEYKSEFKLNKVESNSLVEPETLNSQQHEQATNPSSSTTSIDLCNNSNINNTEIESKMAGFNIIIPEDEENHGFKTLNYKNTSKYPSTPNLPIIPLNKTKIDHLIKADIPNSNSDNTLHSPKDTSLENADLKKSSYEYTTLIEEYLSLMYLCRQDWDNELELEFSGSGFHCENSDSLLRNKQTSNYEAHLHDQLTPIENPPTDGMEELPVKVCNNKTIPLYAHFETEDWKLLEAYIEIHLLIQAFKRDVSDVLRQSIYIEHFPYYYRLYYDRQFRYSDYPACSKADDLLDLLQASIKLSAPPSVLLSHLPEMCSWTLYYKLVERFRRWKKLLQLADLIPIIKSSQQTDTHQKFKDSNHHNTRQENISSYPKDSIPARSNIRKVSRINDDLSMRQEVSQSRMKGTTTYSRGRDTVSDRRYKESYPDYRSKDTTRSSRHPYPIQTPIDSRINGYQKGISQDRNLPKPNQFQTQFSPRADQFKKNWDKPSDSPQFPGSFRGRPRYDYDYAYEGFNTKRTYQHQEYYQGSSHNNDYKRKKNEDFSSSQPGSSAIKSVDIRFGSNYKPALSQQQLLSAKSASMSNITDYSHSFGSQSNISPAFTTHSSMSQYGSPVTTSTAPQSIPSSNIYENTIPLATTKPSYSPLDYTTAFSLSSDFIDFPHSGSSTNFSYSQTQPHKHSSSYNKHSNYIQTNGASTTYAVHSSSPNINTPGGGDINTININSLNTNTNTVPNFHPTQTYSLGSSSSTMTNNPSNSFSYNSSQFRSSSASLYHQPHNKQQQYTPQHPINSPHHTYTDNHKSLPYTQHNITSNSSLNAYSPQTHFHFSESSNSPSSSSKINNEYNQAAPNYNGSQTNSYSQNFQQESQLTYHNQQPNLHNFFKTPNIQQHNHTQPPQSQYPYTGPNTTHKFHQNQIRPTEEMSSAGTTSQLQSHYNPTMHPQHQSNLPHNNPSIQQNNYSKPIPINNKPNNDSQNYYGSPMGNWS